jgi:predicted DNA-binding protein YlxM (UPF0122 family)
MHFPILIFVRVKRKITMLEKSSKKFTMLEKFGKKVTILEKFGKKKKTKKPGAHIMRQPIWPVVI